MKSQLLFSGKNKKNIINLSSAELAQRGVKVKHTERKVFCELRLSNGMVLDYEYLCKRYLK